MKANQYSLEKIKIKNLTNNIIYWILGIILIIATTYFVLYTIKMALDTITTLATSIIGAASVIFVVFMKNINSRNLQFEAHSQRMIEQNKLELQKRKQHNYSKLLESLAIYIRDKNANNDKLSIIRMGSWIYGSKHVIENTERFISERSDESIKDLLLSMREDIGFGLDDLKNLEIGEDMFDVIQSGALNKTKQSTQ